MLMEIKYVVKIIDKTELLMRDEAVMQMSNMMQEE